MSGGANLENDTEKRRNNGFPNCEESRKAGAVREDGTVRITEKDSNIRV